MARKKGKRPVAAPKEPSGGHGVAYAPPRKYRFNSSHEAVRAIADRLPKGRFGIVANESARYTVFLGEVLAMAMPPGAMFALHTGCYVVDSCNRLFDGMEDDEDWCMIMGDDHRFPPEFALKLLSLMYNNDLDIIVPVCFKRDFPPSPVLYKYQEANPEVSEVFAYNSDTGRALFPIDLNDFPEGGLIEVDAAGSAGMIVRKRVIDAMEPPWFQLGREQWGEDLDFCRRAQELGFKIWADLDMPLGHIVNTTLWPVRHANGEWAVEYDFGSQGGFVLDL